jgi:hypothetical protein
MLLVIAMLMKNPDIRRIAIGCLAVIALTALPAYLTGKAAEESVEHLPWSYEPLIEQHERWAFISLISIGIVGIIALIGFLLSHKSERLPAWFLWCLLIIILANAGLIFRTANLGGQIRHTEIRSVSSDLYNNISLLERKIFEDDD